MKLKRTLLSAVLFTFCCGSLPAAPLLTEGFETYARGALDAEISGGPNSSTNGAWAGPFPAPDNCHITGVEFSPNGVLVTPHGGTNMVRGSLRTSDFDEDLYNLSFWLNATNNHAAFLGNFSLDWWFFDSVGQGTNGATPSVYCDYLALSFFGSVPPNRPYDPNIATDGIGDPDGQIAIGGTANQSVIFDGTNELSGYDKTKYQALDITQNGYDGFGWFNIPTAVRSVGWHHARIEVLPQRADSSVDAALYVDNMLVPGLRFNPPSPNGFNSLELNANFGQTTNISAYWDDISFSVLPAPGLSFTVAGTNAILAWSNSWILQSTTNLAAKTWTDVVDSKTNFVTSPYTNLLNAKSQLLFRLRN